MKSPIFIVPKLGAHNLIFHSVFPFTIKNWVELAWRSGSVMDCHATARCLIPGGNGVKTQLHVLRKGQQMTSLSMGRQIKTQTTDHSLKLGSVLAITFHRAIRSSLSILLLYLSFMVPVYLSC